ncbi:MAG: hypothetical protein JXQ90_21450 [Cyclobacteriaceae bacterium]
MKFTYSVCQLATPNIDSFAKFSLASVLSYCREHGYHYAVQRSLLDNQMHVNWTKIILLQELLKTCQTDYVVLLDADALLINQQLDLDYFVRLGGEDKHILMPEDTTLFRKSRPNAGFIIVKNSEIGRAIVDLWIDAARGEGAHLADTHPRNQMIYWNYVQPQFDEYQHIIPLKFAVKYFWYTNLKKKERFLVHLTNSGTEKRSKAMGRLYHQCINDLEALKLISGHLAVNEGLINIPS